MSSLTSFTLKLPFLLPVVWLAIFASKRRSEAARLQQEYSHKEALAKSYQSFKIQAEALGREDSALESKLLESAIDAIAFNPSSTLNDKRHGDKTPIHQAIESVADSGEKIKEVVTPKANCLLYTSPSPRD